jgi:hypothetical protein
VFKSQPVKNKVKPQRIGTTIVKQISIRNSSTTKKTCLDINHALGPDLDYHCHPLGTRDYQNQQLRILENGADANY